MKRIVTVIVALAAMTLMLCSCEKHAYSETWDNFFTVVQGESKYVSEGKTTMSVGETVYIYASDRSKVRKPGGSYKFENNSEGVVKASVGQYEGEDCITVTALKPGTGSVTMSWVWRGFDMHKSIAFTVNE